MEVSLEVEFFSLVVGGIKKTSLSVALKPDPPFSVKVCAPDVPGAGTLLHHQRHCGAGKNVETAAPLKTETCWYEESTGLSGLQNEIPVALKSAQSERTCVTNILCSFYTQICSSINPNRVTS